MKDLLAGKVAVVTGAASGIGRATAELFAACGAAVVVADVDVEGGEQVAGSLEGTAAFQRVDVSDAEQVQALIDFAVSTFGGLHVMCNNAGIGGSLGAFLYDDFSDFDRIMKVNLMGAMLGTQRAARHMKAHGGGSIVNIGSIGGINAGAGVTSYRTAKAALIHLTKSNAVELGRYLIRVNCIAPAHIATAMTSYDMGPVIEANQPLPRHGQPEDVAYAALYLASEWSAQVTGIVLPIDGGTAAGRPPQRIKPA
ncbi:MAG TPA: SDR family oxidoreductase [Frankiaceae bacterium]|jgi:NAD(P)-dependent dehydrogenase (short-subunit alcohol dehydrogenase family)|nr:SDR family oxidoreductase [Frankiaceae bacterium]